MRATEHWTVERIDVGAGRVVRVASCRSPDGRLDAVVIAAGWSSDAPSAFAAADLVARAVVIPPPALPAVIEALRALAAGNGGER